MTDIDAATPPVLPGHDLAVLVSRPGGDIVVLRGVRHADGARVIVRTHRTVPPDPDTRDRLLRQHEAMAAVTAEGVATPLALVESPQRVAIVLADPGGRLLDVAALATPTAALQLACDLTSALARVHDAGWWHLDLREQDVVVSGSGPVIIGLGAAAPSHPTPTADVPDPLGPHHAGRAPESGWLRRAVDGRADQYGLGVLLYRALAGRDPLQVHSEEGLGAAQRGRRPAPLHTIDPALGTEVSALADRLLAADPEQRLRSWAEVQRHLRTCLDALSGMPAAAGTAQATATAELILPEALFGRAAQRQALVQAWQHTQAIGRPHLVLVSGESGAGKSALVADAIDALRTAGVRCGEGGADLLGPRAPFATAAHALSQVIDQLLAAPESHLQQVVSSLRDHLGSDAGLAVSLLPPLARLLGDHAPQAGDDGHPAGDQRHRIDRTVVDVVRGLAAVDMALVLVLEDLQWADPSTLHLLGLLLAEASLGPVLLIGTVRSDELTPGHPVTRAREGWVQAGAEISQIPVGPLDVAALADLLGAALQLPAEETAELARSVHQHTGGNALFSRIHIAELAQVDLIRHDVEDGRWRWDLTEIARQNLTRSAPELIRARIARSDPAVRELLDVAAHMDRVLQLPVLADLLGTREADVRDRAARATAEGLLRVDGERYAFPHDRVRQAVLEAVDPAERDRLHLRIGRTLRGRLDPGRRGASATSGADDPAGSDDEALFAVVSQLNRVRHLLSDPVERADLVALDRTAAQHAHGRGAYDTALGLQEIALEMLPGPDPGDRSADADRRRSDRGDLLVRTAHNALLAGRPDLIEPWCEEALALTSDPVERGRAHLVLFLHWWQQQRPKEMLAALRRTLADFGDPLPAATGVPHVLAEAATTVRALRGLEPEDVLALPPSTDPVNDAVVRVSLATANAGYVHDPLTMVLLGLRNTRRMVAAGISPASAYALCTYGFVLTAILGRVESGHAWSSAAVAMGHRPDSSARGATVFMHNAFIAHWARPLADTLAPLRESHQVGTAEGDVGYPVAGLFFHDLHALLLGHPLDALTTWLEAHADVMRTLHQWSNLQRLAVVSQAVAELRDEPGADLLDGSAFSAPTWLQEHPKPTDLTLWIAALRGFLALRHGRMPEARAAAEAGHGLGRLAPGQAVVALQAFNEGVVWADAARTARGRERGVLLARAGRALLRLRRWRANAPENHAHRVALVQAEIAATTGRPAVAMAAYERAATLAADHGWLSDLGLVCDRATAFHQRQGAAALAAHYVTRAIAAHRSWRADGVVATLSGRWAGVAPGEVAGRPDLTPDGALAAVGRTIGADLTAEELMGRMLELLVEQSGATAGFLVLPHAEELRVEAVARVQGDAVVVDGDLSPSLSDHDGLSAPIVRYVARTRELLQIDDVGADRRQRLDPLLHATGVRSVLCLPLTTPGGLAGVVHLTNDLTAGAFDADRIEVLRLLSVQAAIAIDNARLATGTRRLTADLEDMRRAAHHLADQALTDPLTGLPNRYWLDARLEEALRLAHGSEIAVAVLYCDLDGFKAVNDTFGHRAGDDLLIDMAKRLTTAVRPGDTVTRVGGDEFVVLLQSAVPDESDLAGAAMREVGERIIASCSHVVELGGTSLPLGVSVGAAVAAPGHDTAERLLARADAAMYRAKSLGRGAVVIAPTD